MRIPAFGRLEVGAKAALGLIASGRPPENLHVREPLEIGKDVSSALPDGLTVPTLLIRSDTIRALPARLTARRIVVRGKAVASIGPGLRCDVLEAPDSTIEALPADIEVRQRINLSGSRRLTRLPDNLRTGSLTLSNCVALKDLPRGLDVAFLELSGCTSLRRLPDDIRIRGGRLGLRDCGWITALPGGLGEISEVDVSGCLNLTRMPEGLKVTSWLDLANTAITALPTGFEDAGLRWRGVPVSHRIVFQPETLRADEILSERNAELRRVMMERFGYERLFEAANATEIDRDRDAGGERRLLRIALEGDEDVVCVSVVCPSTDRRFILRVPAHMRSCRQAVAWTAGYDNPDDYAPAVET